MSKKVTVYKVAVDFEELAKRVNSKLDSAHGLYYVKAVYDGKMKSAAIKAAIDEILAEDRSAVSVGEMIDHLNDPRR